MIAQAGRIAVLIITLAAAGCASGPPPQEAAHSSTVGQRAAAVALDQVGARYEYGGASPDGFDCSGLVHYAYRRAGLAVPRTTKQLWAAADQVPRSDLQAGDLLFFSIEGKMSHVGLYLGQDRFVHAPQSGRTVSVASLRAPFYRSALLRAGRIY